jgi:cobalt/nickel transport system ATP-binding protein
MNPEWALKIENLRFEYPDGTRALDGVCLEARRGEKVGIIGANGAGKSSLLLHLNGILRSDGAVSIFGLPAVGRNLKAIRQKVGFVFQNPDDQLFCPTVYDDVAFGPRNLRLSEDEVRARVMESLEEVGMAGFERKSAFHLSLGQKKRVSLATVLALRVELLAMDEPTCSLDPKGRNALIELLARIPVAQIIATHDLGLVSRLCDRVILLSHGRIVAGGIPRDILSNHALLAEHDLE